MKNNEGRRKKRYKKPKITTETIRAEKKGVLTQCDACGPGCVPPQQVSPGVC